VAGETNLEVLLQELSPSLGAETFVVCTLPEEAYGALASARPLASIREAEGLTLVLTQSEADAHGLTYEGTHRCITLRVHSSLEAVGLTAAVSRALADAGISANILAGYYHDHVLVPDAQADAAMVRLSALGSSLD
jgi:hypothetical protein